MHAPHPRVLSCLLSVMLAVGGCATTLTTSLAYNHADWLLTRQLDDYLDLSRSQKAFVSARLDRILDRHRREALPRYEDILSQIQQRIQRGLTGEDLEWAISQYDLLRTDLFSRFAEDGADFVRLIEDRQIPRLRKALRQRLAKQETLVREGLEARRSKRAEQIVALTKEWLGPMSGRQEQEVARLAMAFPDTLPAAYSHQLQRNEELLAVAESRNHDDATAKLSDWLIHPERNADPYFLEVTRQLKEHIGSLILALDRLATPDQRRHVLAKLDSLERTIQQLEGAS